MWNNCDIFFLRGVYILPNQEIVCEMRYSVLTNSANELLNIGSRNLQHKSGSSAVSNCAKPLSEFWTFPFSFFYMTDALTQCFKKVMLFLKFFLIGSMSTGEYSRQTFSLPSIKSDQYCCMYSWGTWNIYCDAKEYLFLHLWENKTR